MTKHDLIPYIYIDGDNVLSDMIQWLSRYTMDFNIHYSIEPGAQPVRLILCFYIPDPKLTHLFIIKFMTMSTTKHIYKGNELHWRVNYEI